MSTRAKVKVKPKRAPEPPPLPPGCEVLMTREQVIAAMGGGICLRKFNGMVAAGKYPPPDIRIGANPRWRVATHNDWLRARCRKPEK